MRVSLESLVVELRRRRVFRALMGWGVAAFAVLQVIEPVMHGLRWPDGTLSYVVVALAMGFPAVALLAWAFDLRAGRLVRAPAAAAGLHLRGPRLVLLLCGVGAVAAAPGLAWYLVRGHGAASPGRPAAGSTPDTEPPGGQGSQRWLVPLGSAPVRGPADALVTIVEFADFQCPYTKQAAPLIRRLEARFPDKLRLAWKDYPLGAHADADAAAQLAGEARRQQGDEGFWKAHDLLLARSPRVGPDELEAIAQELGLDLAEARRAIASERSRAAIDADVEALARIGTGGTPTFFVNGRMVEGEGEEELARAVTEALDEARRTLASGVPRERLYQALQEGARASREPTRRVDLPDAGPRPARGGPAGRAVAVHEFCDLSLARCAWFEPVLRRTLQSYGEEVRLVWWDVGDPQRPEARRARRAALAAGSAPGGFWRMHDAILADLRTEDFRLPPPERLGLAALRDHARRLGLDLATYDYAMAADEESVADRDEVEQARALGLRPGTLVIDGEVHSGFDPPAILRGAIDRALTRRR